MIDSLEINKIWKKMAHLKRNDCWSYLNGHLKGMRVSKTQLLRGGNLKQQQWLMKCPGNPAGLWLSEGELRKPGGR